MAASRHARVRARGAAPAAPTEDTPPGAVTGPVRVPGPCGDKATPFPGSCQLGRSTPPAGTALGTRRALWARTGPNPGPLAPGEVVLLRLGFHFAL